MRVKITGYYSPRPDEKDDELGLTSEAYERLISDEYSTGLKVADLEEIDTQVVR